MFEASRLVFHYAVSPVHMGAGFRPGKLAEWVEAGLWGDNPDHARCTEGFNRALLGHWRRRELKPCKP